MPHQAHHGLGRVELLGHERLGGRRSWSLPHCTSPGPRAGPRAAAVVILVLTVRVGAVAASSIPAAAISVGGGGGRRALAVPASPSAAVPTIAAAAALAAAATARRTHSPVTLVLVHQVGVVRIGAAAETRPATWKCRRREGGT